MKNSILFVVFILLCFGVNAMAGEKSVSYVKTDSEVYIGQDLKIGLFNAKVISLDGTVTKVPKSDIVAYMHNSQLIEVLPIIDENNDTVEYAKMEYVTSKGGLNLYRYCCYETLAAQYEFYVYKEGKFHLRINCKNAPTVLPFFGIKVIKC